MTIDDQTPPEDPYATPEQEQAEATPEVPWSEAAEREVLGAVMLNAIARDDVLSVMAPTDFYLPRHEMILAAVLELAQASKPHGVVATADALERKGQLTKVGGIEYLFGLTSAVYATANAGYHAKIVAEHAVRRRVIEAATRALQSAQSRETDAATLLAHVRSDVDAASSTAMQTPRRIRDALPTLVDAVSSDPSSVPTPWLELDRVLGGGLRPGKLYVVGARPGKGKTAFALQIAGSLARRGPVGFFSLEMDEQELLMRMASSVGTIPFSALLQSALTDTDWRSMVIVKNALEDVDLFVFDDATTRLAQLEAYARVLAREGNLQGLVVDYLQLLRADGDWKNRRQEEVAELSRRLKLLAKTLNVPIIALSQLNRAATKRKGGKGEEPPALTDLRESGAIEQDADVVMLLHRDDESTDLVVSIAKNRAGRLARVTLEWQGQFMRAVTQSKSVGEVPFDTMEEDHHER